MRKQANPPTERFEVQNRGRKWKTNVVLLFSVEETDAMLSSSGSGGGSRFYGRETIVGGADGDSQV